MLVVVVVKGKGHGRDKLDEIEIQYEIIPAKSKRTKTAAMP